MSEWKLTHLGYGKIYTFKEGDNVTIGRAPTNTIPISSMVISRKHCVIHFDSGKICITDTKSYNGVYVGNIKIPQNEPYKIKNRDIIVIGSTDGLNREKLPEDLQFMFELTRVNTPRLISRLKYESENEIDEIENKIAALDSSRTLPVSPVRTSSRSLKRNVVNDNGIKKENKCRIFFMDDDVVNLLSDSDQDNAADKPFTKITKKKSEEMKNDSSYSQLDENVIDLCFPESDNEEDDFMEDIIFIPPLSPPLEQTAAAESPIQLGDVSDLELEHDIISLQGSMPMK